MPPSFASEEAGLIVAPAIVVEHLKNILLLPLLVPLLNHLLHNILLGTHWNHLFLFSHNNFPLLQFAISTEGVDDILYGLVVGQHFLVVAAALCGILGANMATHEDVDLHESLILPILLKQLHILPQEADVLPILMRLPVALLRFTTAVLLQPTVVLLLRRKDLAILGHHLLPGGLQEGVEGRRVL
jgi:hypothetical protein